MKWWASTYLPRLEPPFILLYFHLLIFPHVSQVSAHTHRPSAHSDSKPEEMKTYIYCERWGTWKPYHRLAFIYVNIHMLKKSYQSSWWKRETQYESPLEGFPMLHIATKIINMLSIFCAEQSSKRPPDQNWSMSIKNFSLKSVSSQLLPRFKFGNILC